MSVIFTTVSRFQPPLEEKKVKKHRPGGVDHDQSLHGSWSDGQTVPPGSQQSPDGPLSSVQPVAAPSGQDYSYYRDKLFQAASKSRTFSGVIDTSGSEGKAGAIAMTNAQEVAAQAQSNFQATFDMVYENKDFQFESPEQVLDFFDSINAGLNNGIVKEGTLLRTANSAKFPYTDVSQLHNARIQFATELMQRIDTDDPVELAAWINWRVNLLDHWYEDGVGRTTDMIVGWAMARRGHAMPDTSGMDRSEWFANAPTVQRNPSVGPQVYEGADYNQWSEFYRGLFGQDVEKHYGPGPHPGTLTPQMVHSPAGRRTLKAALESARFIARTRRKDISIDEYVDFNVSLAPEQESWVYAWETYRRQYHELAAEKKARLNAYLSGQYIRSDHPMMRKSEREESKDLTWYLSDLKNRDYAPERVKEFFADNPWDEVGYDENGYGYSQVTHQIELPPGYTAETWGAKVKAWQDKKPLEVEELARAKMKTIIDNSDVYIQVHSSTVPEILEDGGFTTLYEYGADSPISGDEGNAHRRAYEEDTFGITGDDIPPTRRPIYGYLWDKDDKDGAVIPENELSLGNPRTSLMHYGTVAIRLKPEVRERTTFNFGDSYSLQTGVLPQPLTNPGWQAHGFLGGIVGYGMIGNDATKPTDGMGWRKGWTYIEAQIHGGVTLDDIEEIIIDTTDPVERHRELPFPKDWVTEWPELKEMLDDSGVPWRITDRPLT